MALKLHTNIEWE